MSVFASPIKTSERVNLALGKTTEASSIEVSKWGPDKTVDGITDRGTDITKPGQSRWSSNAIRNGESPQWVTIDLGEVKTFNEVVVEWERNNITSYKIEISDDKESWTAIHEGTSISALRDVISLEESQKARYVKVNVLNNNPSAVVNWDNVSIYEIEVYNNAGEEVEPPAPPVEEETDKNLALNKIAVASGLEVDGSLTADKVTDGDVKSNASRWSSAAVSDTNPQWIYVDLGEETAFDKVKLFWQNANATIYEIQISNDAQNWTSINRKENAPGGVELISFDKKQNARYVRVFCEKNNPAVWSSVSLFEVEIYNGKLPQSIDEVIETIEAPVVSKGDTKLTMPTVAGGYEISFIGADYKQVIGDDMVIHQPLVDTKVIVDFEVTKENQKATTKGLEVIVPGVHTNESDDNAKPTVIPELREWAGASGNFEISDSSRILVNPANEAELMETAKVFADDYKDIIGKEIEVVVSEEPQAGDFYLTLGSTYESIGEEGSFINISDKVVLEGNHPTGVFYGTRSVLQILKQTGNTIPMGMVRDYPRYEVRGFMLDVARKPFSLEFLEEMTKTMSWYKMNDFQVHLNDNYIFLEDYGADALEKGYAAFRLESNDVGENGVPLTAQDLSYSKEEFSNFIDGSKLYGVNIVPEIEAPAHALAITKAHPEFVYGNGQGREAEMLDVTNPKVVEYVKELFSEYVDGENPVFRDATVHIGSDEFHGSSQEYRTFADEMLKFMRDEKGRTTRIWGSLSQKSGSVPVTSEDIQMNIWNTGWADPSDMYDQGYDIINTEDSKLYIVPAAGYYYDYLNSQSLYNNWTPNKFGNGDVIPAGSPQMIGGMFAVWNDMIDKKSNGIVEYDIFDRILPGVQALSEKLWGTASDKTYEEFQTVAKKVSTAPNTNPFYKVDSETEKVIEYKLDESITELKDTSGNGYNVVKTENVESVKGKDGKAISLKGGASYIESPVSNLGPNYTVSMTVKRDATSGNEEQVLFESSKGSFKAVQKDTGKVGFSRELYDFSFDYELPVGEWAELSIVGMMNKTQLYVNGVLVDEISKAGTDGKYHGTFVFPLETIGSKTNSFKGLVDEIVVSNTKMVSDKSIIPQEYMTATATSEQAGGSEGPASLAIDGNESSIWHTKYSPGKDELPQSITLNLGKEYNVNKFTYLPRPNGGNGNITSYEVLVSTDGENFTKVSNGEWESNASLKVVEFEPVKATHIRLTAKAGVGGFASAAELNVHQVIENEVVENEKVTIGSIDEVNVNESFDVNLGFADIKEENEYYSADLTFVYNPEVFELNEVTSTSEKVIVTSKEDTKGQVRVIVSSLGTPITNVADLIKVNLKSIKTSENEELAITSAQVGDGDGNVADLELANKNIIVKPIDENIVVSKVDNLEATEVTKNTVKLTWDAPSSLVGLTEYIVYKDGKEFARVPVGTTELVVDKLRTNTNYGFKVTAKYSNDKESKPKSINVRTKK
ncbi:MAG: discoidin domain-containing protein [Clostridium sp.]